MAALLAVEQNNTDKVTVYVADCRRMGIEVLPPDINASQWDFTIEDRTPTNEDAPATAIRFGLGAVKNVGQGPVEIILEARADGPFTDINDFVRRTDLRKVGKRALESLIKVGALDVFGPRPALLEGLDRIISISGAHFKAADAGQMSLFGEQTGLIAKIQLPPAKTEITRREQLNWERELIGVYISDHPLAPVMDAITQNVTHFSNELHDTRGGQQVRVAGLVTRLRPHITKKGAPMAFVTIEDLQGSIELVIFSRTWERVREMVEFDAILMVDGKIDDYGAEPKVLVDSVTTQLNHVQPLRKTPPRQAPQSRKSDRKPPKADSPPPQSDPAPPPLQETAESRDTPPVWDADEDMPPPPPDLFPPGWEETFEPASPQPAAVEVYSELMTAAESAFDPTPETPDPEAETPPKETEPAAGSEPAAPVAETVSIPEAVESTSTDTPPPENIPVPILPPATARRKTGEIQMITVILRPRNDKARDKLLLRRVFGLLISYPGDDRFAFQIFEHGRGHLMEFPNMTTGITPELVAEMRDLVGAENIRIEPITFQ